MSEPDIELVLPDDVNEDEALAFRQAFRDAGEMIMPGSALFDQIESFEEWRKRNRRYSDPENIQEDWPLSRTWFARRKEDGKIIGMIDLRFWLNDFLKDLGHVGYCVHPDERRKGYGAEMLEMVCREAGNHGLDHLQLCAEEHNVASQKVILKNGARKVREAQVDEKGYRGFVYEIALEDEKNTKKA